MPLQEAKAKGGMSAALANRIKDRIAKLNREEEKEVQIFKPLDDTRLFLQQAKNSILSKSHAARSKTIETEHNVTILLPKHITGYAGTNLSKSETLDILHAFSHLRKIIDDLEHQFSIGKKDPRYKRGTQLQAICALNEEFNRLSDTEPFISDIIKRVTRNPEME
jgi:hypothetical protein